jgi:hypothetical protein
MFFSRLLFRQVWFGPHQHVVFFSKESHMKRAAIAMAVAAVSGIGIASAHADNGKANTPTTAPSPSQVTANHSHDPMASPEVSIRDLVGRLTNDAVETGNLGELVAQFDQPAQERITKSSDFSKGYGAKLDAQIDTISKDWKQKYGHDFDAKNFSDIFGSAFATIETGMPAKDAQLSAKFAKVAGQSATSQEIALAHIQGPKSGVSLEVPFVLQSAGNWRIAVPDSLTLDKLRANLLDQMTALASQTAQLPANENDAYRQVAHHVLTAILDKPAAAQKQAAATPTMTPAPAKSVRTISTASTYHWWQFWKW